MRSTILISTVLALVLLCGCANPGSQPIPKHPDTQGEEREGFGLYETMHQRQKIQTPGAHIDYPYLAGAYFIFPMIELEPEEGNYDFSEIDNLINIWKTKNKKIVLGIVVSGGGGGNTMPEWIFEEGAKYIETEKNEMLEKQPVLWDDIFLAEYEEFISKLAQQYDNNNAIEFVIIGTGVFSTTAVNYPAAIRDPEICQLYKEYGYSDKLWYETILKMVEINKKYFKHTPLALGINDFYLGEERNCLPNKDSEYNYLKLAREIADMGVYVFIHHLGQYITLQGSPRWDQMVQELNMLSEVDEDTKIVLGMDNPTTTRNECGEYRFGDPEKIIDYAFGGVDTIPSIDTSYIFFYEQDLDAAEDGEIGKYNCLQWKQDFDNAFSKAYENFPQ